MGNIKVGSLVRFVPEVRSLGYDYVFRVFAISLDGLATCLAKRWSGEIIRYFPIDKLELYTED